MVIDPSMLYLSIRRYRNIGYMLSFTIGALPGKSLLAALGVPSFELDWLLYGLILMVQFFVAWRFMLEDALDELIDYFGIVHPIEDRLPDGRRERIASYVFNSELMTVSGLLMSTSLIFTAICYRDNRIAQFFELTFSWDWLLYAAAVIITMNLLVLFSAFCVVLPIIRILNKRKKDGSE